MKRNAELVFRNKRHIRQIAVSFPKDVYDNNCSDIERTFLLSCSRPFEMDGNKKLVYAIFQYDTEKEKSDFYEYLRSRFSDRIRILEC